MTPRPAPAKKSRPLSAIFIGSAGSTPPTLPDLPEPPSPSTSSTSGLPSPPATNSTGSGSVGEGSTDAGSLRHRTPKLTTSTSSMSGGGFGYEYRKKRSSAIADEDDADENENDEDNTARLDLRRRSFTKGADNASALQRVKTLTERNRMVLDKLTSISRLGSPAPSTTRSRSPLSPPTASSTSSSASATSSSRKSSSQSRPPSVTNASLDSRRRDTQLSGSETERESQRHSTYSTSSDDRTTPPPSAFPLSGARGSASVRQRRISAPASPGKVRAATRDNDRASPGPSRTARKHVSVISVDEGHGYCSDDDDDVTTAALAAVASSRRSPTGSGGKKGRQPLPKEFRDRKLSDEKAPNHEPATPHRLSNRAELGRASPSPRKTRVIASDPPESPRRLGQSRYSTVKELTRKHQMRWMSEDLSSPSRERSEQTFDGPGRRQGHRTGSSEGLLGTAGGRSLVGEGLRAAGLTKRRDEDVFVSTNDGAQASTLGQRTRSNGNSSIISSSEGDSSFDRSLDVGSRVDEGVGPPRDPKTPINASMRARPQSGVLLRPGTSMAALHHDDAPPRTAPPALRAYRSTYTLQDRNVEDLQRQVQDRSSPYGTIRSSTAQSGIREANGDHRRLMLEALTMFESHLSRLPPMGQTTTSTIPEVFQSAQHLVHSLDKLNAMLKEGTNKALEAQIDAELADYKDGVDLPELWREVGSDHRENLRVSDEVVRNMTGFMLGVGKILREATSGTQHLRTMSLDEEVTRRVTPDIQLNGNGRDLDGRRSSLRRSWEPGKETARLMRLSTGLEENGRMGSRPGSSLNVLRSSTTNSSSEGRSVTEANDGTPATVRQSAPISASTSAARRLYTPRERVDSNAIPLSPDEFGALGDYEPSPTPLSRQSHASLPSHRALPSLAVAPSLPTLPSESLLTRSASSFTGSTDKLSRRKISASSIVTIRPEPTPFTPSIKPSNPTTAVTTATVSLSPENSTAFPLQRSESGSSSRSNGVTFSRPSTTSVSSTLTGLQQQHERAPTTLSPAAAISSPQSGSESERERSDRDRDSRSRTISARPRVSMETIGRGEASPVEAVRRSLATTVSYSAARKERRRTITEIFSHR